MAIQSKIYIGFADNFKEYLPDTNEFVKLAEQNLGITLIVLARSEIREGFKDSIQSFWDKIYDKRAFFIEPESDNYADTVEDVEYTIKKRKLSNKETEIYILKNTDFFNVFKEKNSIECKSISESDIICQEKPKEEKTTSSQMADAFMASILMNKNNIFSGAGLNKNNNNNTATNNKATTETTQNTPEKTGKKVVVEPPVTKPPNTANGTLNPVPNNNADLIKQRKSSLIGKGAGAKEEPKPDPRTILELEKAILNSDFIDNEINLNYTELDDAKAKLVNGLSNRLIDHINALYTDIQNLNLNYADYTKAFDMFNKAKDSDEFLSLWSNTFPDKEIISEQDKFEKIKSEANYYLKVCNFLYSEDKFDVFKI